RQESGGRNSLTRIAVTTGSEVGFGETVDDALADLVDGYEPPAQEGDEPTEPTVEGEPSEGDETPQEPDRTTEEALAEADTLFDEADAALVDGDLGEYQDKVSEARALLEEALSGLTGVPATDGAASDTNGETTTTTVPDG
ncbi:MAG: hypothetical protein ACR2OH_02550, partial [Microthrixaceae bacterium]